MNENNNSVISEIQQEVQRALASSINDIAAILDNNHHNTIILQVPTYQFAGWLAVCERHFIFKHYNNSIIKEWEHRNYGKIIEKITGAEYDEIDSWIEMIDFTLQDLGINIGNGLSAREFAEKCVMTRQQCLLSPLNIPYSLEDGVNFIIDNKAVFSELFKKLCVMYEVVEDSDSRLEDLFYAFSIHLQHNLQLWKEDKSEGAFYINMINANDPTKKTFTTERLSERIKEIEQKIGMNASN